MMDVDDYLERHLPPALLRVDKDRIKEGLKQFFPSHRQGDMKYADFYFSSNEGYFMQGDLIHSLPVVYWDYDNSRYETAYSPVMLVSNSCDVSADNARIAEEEALFAQAIALDDYIKDLIDEGTGEEKIKSILSDIRNQRLTNIFYLPSSDIMPKEFLVFFDKICWHPSDVFAQKLEKINEERNLSLSNWGYYLLVFKLSIHFCRVPEEVERVNKAVA